MAIEVALSEICYNVSFSSYQQEKVGTGYKRNVRRSLDPAAAAVVTNMRINMINEIII